MLLLPVAAALLFVTPQEKDRAYKLYQEAEKAYDQGHADRAVELLNEAYRLSPEPVLLYNLARAQETLGQLESAVDAYRRYLQADPAADGRGAISARIASLEQQLKERERLRQERIAAELEAKAAKGGAPGWVWPVTVGAAALVAGGVLKGLAFRERDLAQAEPIHEAAVARFHGAQGFDTASTVTFVAGAAIFAAGIIWLIVWKNRTTLPLP